MTLPIIATPTYTMIQPSTGKQISFRPFLVKEEKILLMAAEEDDPKEAQRESVKAIKEVIQNCCTGLDSIDNLPLFDLEYIFLQLRSKSVGEIVRPEIKCTECGETIKLKIDLSKVQVIKPEGHKFDIRIDENVRVKMRYPSFAVFETRLAGGEDISIEKMFDVLIDCIESIYTDEEIFSSKDYTRQDMMNFLDSLTQEQFQKIQDFFETSPRLEHTAKYTCKNKVRTGDTTSKTCGHKGQIVLNTVLDFFV